MQVRPSDLSSAEIRQQAQAWYDRQIETLKRCHGVCWPQHEAWLTDYLKSELRQRLLALGWRPKA